MNRLFNGDCLELIKDIPDKSIDLVITDPPYQFQPSGGGFYSDNNLNKRKYCDDLNNLNCCEFEVFKFLNLIEPKIKDFYGYFFCNKTLISDYMKWARKHNYIYDLLVMAKNNPIPAHNGHYISDLEYIMVVKKKGAVFNDGLDIENYKKFYLTNCQKGIHPAQKPVKLIERFIKVASNENDVILDPFMGSGTTGVACKNLNRDFIGIELDKKYFNIAKQRINGEVIQEEIEDEELNSYPIFL